MHFEELIARLSPKLKGITHKLNGRFTFFNEEDLYQEAMLHLWLAHRDGQIQDKTDSYILQGCFFHLKNYIRKTQDKASLISMYHLAGEEEARESEAVLSLAQPNSTLDDINAKVLIEEILNNGLTKREKEVFRLALIGLTTREIGNRLGISHVRVVKLKAAIRDKCRKYQDTYPKPTSSRTKSC